MTNTYKRETFIRGSAFAITATLKDGDGTVLDIAAANLEAQVNTGTVSNPTKLADLTVADLEPAVPGTVLLSTDEDTSTWPLGEIRVGLRATIGEKLYLSTAKAYHVIAGEVVDGESET